MFSQKSNIYDAFMYKFKKLIIAFSYTPGLDIQPIIDDMVNTFNFITIKLDGDKMLKPDSYFNYEKLNEEIKKVLDENQKTVELNVPGMFGKGILIYGLNFPQSKINAQIDLQLHYAASVSMFLKANTDDQNIPIYTIDDYNKFKDILADNKVNKYFNIKSSVGSEINDSTFEKIIDFLEWKVYGKDYSLLSTKAKKENAGKKLVNEKPTDVLEISKKNEIIRDEIDKDATDAILSISSDNADYNSKYHTPKKETARYINKKIEDSIQEIDLAEKWDANMENDSMYDMEGGYFNLSNLTDSELEEMLKLV
jgi:hypothetical protein